MSFEIGDAVSAYIESEKRKGAGLIVDKAGHSCRVAFDFGECIFSDKELQPTTYQSLNRTFYDILEGRGKALWDCIRRKKIEEVKLLLSLNFMLGDYVYNKRDPEQEVGELVFLNPYDGICHINYHCGCGRCDVKDLVKVSKFKYISAETAEYINQTKPIGFQKIVIITLCELKCKFAVYDNEIKIGDKVMLPGLKGKEFIVEEVIDVTYTMNTSNIVQEAIKI